MDNSVKKNACRTAFLIISAIAILLVTIYYAQAEDFRGHAGEMHAETEIAAAGENSAVTAYQRRVANAIIQDASIEFIDLETKLADGTGFADIATLENVAQMIARNIPAEPTEASEDVLSHEVWQIDFGEYLNGQMFIEILRAYYAFMEIDIDVDTLGITQNVYMTVREIAAFF